MEDNSLVGGIFGLAGLFSACLDALEKISTYKDFSTDSKVLETQFRADKLRLQKWGRAVGFDNGALLNDHHPALDDDETISMVEDLLQIINNLCQTNDVVPKRLGRVGSGLKQDQGRNPGRSSVSKRERVAWAVWGKGKREDDVNLFSDLIQQLHNLVPPGAPNFTRGDPGVEGRNGATAQEACAHQALEDKLGSQNSVLSEVKQFLFRREEEPELRRDIQSWILGVHSSSDIFEEAVQTRVNGTCDWILQNAEFLRWLAEDSSQPASNLLWIHGPAGFGKTVLFARVIEHLSELPNTLVAHFFFSSDFESRKDPFAAVRSWLCQIMRREPVAFDIVYDAWLGQEAQIPSQSAIEKLFIDVLKAMPECILALDGLDECTSIEKVIKLVAQAVKEPKIRVLIVSRGEPEIRESLEEYIADGFGEYRISIDDVRADTILYSRDVVNQKLHNKSPGIRDDIASRMSDRCDGQFLWIKMQADSFRKGMSQTKLQKISDAPPDLEHIYKRNWDSIIRQQEEEKLRAVTLLRWAAFSLRPLTVSEITEAALVDDDSTEIPTDELPDELDTYYANSEILGLCGSLIELRGNREYVGSMTVHVTHFSVKQFLLLKLTSLEKFVGANGDLNTSYETFQNALLAKKCLQYISFARVWDKTQNGSSQSPEASFREYAAGSWFHHAALVQSDDEKMMELVNTFFGSTDGNWDAWRRWYDTNILDGDMDEEPEQNLLHYACELRLTETLKHLLKKQDCDVNQVGGPRRATPLGAACATGHEELVETLLKAGASFSIGNRLGRTPLDTLAKNGNINLVRLALSNGADPNCVDENGWTPLHTATYFGQYEVVKLLLENGADIFASKIESLLTFASATGHLKLVELFLEMGIDIESREGSSWTPLTIAVSNGHLEVISLLLAKGADLQVLNESGHAALHVAADEGMHDVVNFLLEKGSNIEIKAEDGCTPLHCAASQGHLEVVKCLAEWGCNLDATDSQGTRPICSAATEGHLEVVKFLQEKGADIYTPGKQGRSPFHCAAVEGHLEVAKFLQEKGSKIDTANANGSTPLNSAATQGHFEVVKFLQEIGSEVDSKNAAGWTPLNSAASKGHLEIVKFLQEKGSNIDTANYSGSTPLHCAAYEGHIDIVKFLQEKGCKIDVKNNDRWTPLYCAAYNGKLKVIEFLQDKGSDIEAKDDDGWTPLHSAAGRGHFEVVKLLLETGADIETKSKKGYSPILSAADNGHLSTVKYLIEKGANVNDNDNDAWTPLHFASWSGNIELAKLLLDSGAGLEANSHYGRTPVFLASMQGRLEVVEFLVGEGANVNVRDKSGLTALLTVSTSGRSLEVFKFLLEKSSSANCEQPETLRTALENEDQKEAVDLLPKPISSSPLQMTDTCGRTPLILAARHGHEQLVRVCLDQMAFPLDAKDWCGSTALFAAVRNGHVAAVEQLLGCPGVDLNMRDRFGRACIWWAKNQGHTQIAELLSQKAQERGVVIDDAEPLDGFMPRPFHKDHGWCDVCLLGLPNGEAYYDFKGCIDLAICTTCHKTGVGCLGTLEDTESHELVLSGA